MDIKKFGQRLKELRGDKSQADIVEMMIKKTGISTTAQTLGRYERGERKPDLEIIEALATTFGISADYLLCRTHIKTVDLDIQSFCNYIGCNENVIERIRKFYDDIISYDDEPNIESNKNILNSILSNGLLWGMLEEIYWLMLFSKKHDRKGELVMNMDVLEDTNIPQSTRDYMAACAASMEDMYCDTSRYNALKYLEKLLNSLDEREK